MNILPGFTATPERCFFGLWEGYRNIDDRLYPPEARVKGRGRDYLLFQGPLEAVSSFLDRGGIPILGRLPEYLVAPKTGPGVWRRTLTCTTPTSAAAWSASGPS